MPITQVDDDTTYGSFNSTIPSSEMTSEMSLNSEQVKVSLHPLHHLHLLGVIPNLSRLLNLEYEANIQLCNPSKLRSSQLTDRTFRLYLLDYMSQETSRVVDELSEGELEIALKEVFPEYRLLLPSRDLPQSQVRTPLRSHSLNSHDDPDTTPRQSKTSIPVTPSIPGFTISSILSIPHLEELADLVVEEQSRKEEKRRRRRIRDGTATQKDLQSQSQPQTRSQSMSLSVESKGSTKTGSGWRLSRDEKRSRKERLVKWVIRGLSEEGVLVQIKMKVDRTNVSPSPLRSRTKKYTEAYLPLPEPLLLPLLIPHISAEIQYRSKIYIPRSDPRFGHSILLEEVLKRLRGCGEAGRWERVGEYCVEDALQFGEGVKKGLKRVGRGWVLT